MTEFGRQACFCGNTKFHRTSEEKTSHHKENMSCLPPTARMECFLPMHENKQKGGLENDCNHGGGKPFKVP